MEGETYVQLCTRLQTRLKYYLERRGVGHSYDRLCELVVADKLKSLFPKNPNDFVRQRELGGWLPPQDLAMNVDTYVADRNTGAGGGNQGAGWRRGGGMKAANRVAVAGGAQGQQSHRGAGRGGGRGAGRGAVAGGDAGRGGRRTGGDTRTPGVMCTFCNKPGHQWAKCFRRQQLNQAPSAS